MSGYSVDKQFVCPECGGHMFGTSNVLGDNPKGHCHDFKNDGSRCLFTWDRNTEDKKVFHD